MIFWCAHTFERSAVFGSRGPYLRCRQVTDRLFQTDNRERLDRRHMRYDGCRSESGRADLAAEEWNNADWNSPWGVAVGMTAESVILQTR